VKRIAVLLLASGLATAQAKLPLPDAPVVLVIPDASAFDRALSGGFRKALTGELKDSDPVGAAWKRTRVGGKLESQWELFAKDLPISWKQIAALKPTAVGLSLVSVGDLEAVLAIQTSIAQLPFELPGGTEKSHRGASYRVVSPGAGDDKTATRRMGLAWARAKGTLFLATSERVLKLALDRSLAGEGFSAFVPGIVSVKLDLDALRKDIYFKREFLFDEGPEKGTVLAALRVEGNDLVEVREGTTVVNAASSGASAAETPAGATWPTADRSIAAAGWESEGKRFFSALRRGLLEPVPSPPSKPVPARKALPDPNATGTDRYLVDVTKPDTEETAGAGEGELPGWAEQLKSVDGFGWEIAKSGARRLVVKRSPDTDATFASLALATETRRAAVALASASQIQVVPDLSTLAWKRRGGWLWIAARPEDLVDVPEPATDGATLRWSLLDLQEVRKAGRGWTKAEGAFSPERTRPFSDRILGLLGWMPQTSTLTVERKKAGAGFTERLVWKGEAKAAPAAPKKGPVAKPAPKKKPA